MSMALGSRHHFEPGSWGEILHDVYVGTVVGIRHSIYIVTKWWYVRLVLPLLRAFGVQLGEDTVVKSRDGEKTLKVVAVGFGRTGTYSVTLALEELGFPTLHTQHLYEHEAIISMWTNEVFLPAIRANKALMGRPNLQLIADAGFQATADLPMALYFEQVMEQYPNCKFILTTRDNSEEWFQSWNLLTKTITEPTHLGGFFFTNVHQYSIYLRWLFSVVNKDEYFLTAPFPLPDQNKEAAITAYEDHNRRVRELIPKDQLLEYNVKEGWQPLCTFLEIESCPDTPFPKTNSARSLQVQTISGMIFPLVLVLFVLFYGFAIVFQRLTGMTVIQWADRKIKELKVTLRNVFLGNNQVCLKSKKKT